MTKKKNSEPNQSKPRSPNLLGKKPASKMTALELIPLFKAMARMGRQSGLNTLEPTVNRIDHGYLRLGLRLAIDGVDPKVLKRTLRIRKKSLLADYERKLNMIGEAVIDIQGGLSDRLVEEKCRAFL